MRKAILLMLLLLVAVPGCSSKWGSAGLGAVGGAAAGAGGYEYHLKQQRDQVETDYRAGRMDEKEYRIRIDQINRDSLLR